MRKRRFCRIDRNGCIACGGRTFEQRAVISDALASAWELSAKERADFDEREGNACATCQMSKRVRMLLWSIRRHFPSSRGLRVLHFNQINHRSPALRALGNVTETCYQRGAKVGELLNEDICHLTFPSDHFDLAIHSETLEHLFDFSRGLSEFSVCLSQAEFKSTVPLLHSHSTRRRMQRRRTTAHFTSFHPATMGMRRVPGGVGFGTIFSAQRSSTSANCITNYWQNKTVFTVIEKSGNRREPDQGSMKGRLNLMNNFLKPGRGVLTFILCVRPFLVPCCPDSSSAGEYQSPPRTTTLPLDADLGRIPGTLPANFQQRIERN
jgi:hypothetical protein